MSADMMAATLWIRQNTKPDWRAAENALADFTCPKDGFPADSPLSGHWLEDEILDEYTGKEANTETKCKAIVDEILAGALKVVRQAVEGERRDTTYVIHAGWIVYISGGFSSGEVPTDTAEAIYKIGETGILEAAGFFRKPERVMAVVLESEYDTTVTLVADEKAAEQVVADFCRQFWSRWVVDFADDPPPTDNSEVIETFFAAAPSHWWETRRWVSTEKVAL